MAVYLSLTVVVLAAALLIKRTEKGNMNGALIYRGMSRQQMVNRICCLIIFVLLFAVSALRLNVGNDYLNYVEFMHLAYSKAIIFWYLRFMPLLRFSFS